MSSADSKQVIQPPPPASGRFVRDSLQWLGYLLVGLYCFIIAAFGPIMPMMAAELNYTYERMAYHFSAYALGVLIAGATGDRVMGVLGRNQALWLGTAGMLGGSALIIASHSLFLTIFGAWLVGCTGSIMGQTNNTIMVDRFKEDRAVAITEANIAGSIFCCLAPLMVSLCVRTGIGWRAVFVMPIIVIAFLWLRFGKLAQPFDKSESRTTVATSLPPVYWAFWAVVLLSVSGEWSIVFWASKFMIDVNHFSDADASAAVSVFLAAMLTGRVIGSRLSRMYHVRQLLPASAVLGLVGFLIFWLGKNPTVNLAGLFIAGIGQSNVYPLSFASAIGVGQKQTNSATSRLSLASGIANLSTPMLMGYIADRSGISCAYGVVALSWSAVIALVLVANKMAHRHESGGDAQVA